MATQHTPGPWEIRSSAAREGACIYSAEGYGIGKAWDINDRPENRANARLIAAAPDLLNGVNALLGLLQLLVSRDDISAEMREFLTKGHRVDEARAAVAKAEGVEPFPAGSHFGG